MERGIELIEDNFDAYRSDEEVARSRLFDDQELDAGIIGTYVNEERKRVLVYSDEILVDIIAQKIMDGELGDPPEEDESPWNLAADHLSYRLDSYLHYKKPYAPVVVSEAIEELDSYGEDFLVFQLGNGYWIALR